LKKKNQKNKARQYIDNVKLHQIMTDFFYNTKEAKEKGDPEPRIPEYAGYAIHLICNELGTKRNFARYSYRDEMVGDAIISCVQAAYKFDPEKAEYVNKQGITVSTNAFNYFSTCAWRAFLNRLKKEKRDQYIKHKAYMSHISTINDFGSELSSDNIEVSSRIIDEYESKLERDKQK